MPPKKIGGVPVKVCTDVSQLPGSARVLHLLAPSTSRPASRSASRLRYSRRSGR